MGLEPSMEVWAGDTDIEIEATRWTLKENL